MDYQVIDTVPADTLESGDFIWHGDDAITVRSKDDSDSYLVTITGRSHMSDDTVEIIVLYDEPVKLIGY